MSDDAYQHGREEGLDIGAGEPPELAEQHEREIEGRLAGDTSRWDPKTLQHVRGYLSGLRAAHRPTLVAGLTAAWWRRPLILVATALAVGFILGRMAERRRASRALR